MDPAGAAFWGGVGNVVLLEEVCLSWLALRVKKTHLLPTCPFHALKMWPLKFWLLQLYPPALMPPYRVRLMLLEPQARISSSFCMLPWSWDLIPATEKQLMELVFSEFVEFGVYDHSESKFCPVLRSFTFPANRSKLCLEDCIVASVVMHWTFLLGLRIHTLVG